MSVIDTQPDINQTISDLIAEAGRLRSELAACAAINEVLTNDLTFLAKDMKHEAAARGWCSDYEYWVRHTNENLSRPWLIQRDFDDDGVCDICQEVHYRS